MAKKYCLTATTLGRSVSHAKTSRGRIRATVQPAGDTAQRLIIFSFQAQGRSPAQLPTAPRMTG